MSDLDVWRYPDGTTVVGAFETDQGQVELWHLPLADGGDGFLLTLRFENAVIGGRAFVFAPGEERVIDLGTFNGRPCIYVHGETRCLN